MTRNASATEATTVHLISASGPNFMATGRLDDGWKVEHRYSLGVDHGGAWARYDAGRDGFPHQGWAVTGAWRYCNQAGTVCQCRKARP